MDPHNPWFWLMLIGGMVVTATMGVAFHKRPIPVFRSIYGLLYTVSATVTIISYLVWTGAMAQIWIALNNRIVLLTVLYGASLCVLLAWIVAGSPLPFRRR